MAVIDTFLNKLQRLINVADSVKTNKAINRNASLEIENVLYANGITGEVSYDDLLTLKKNDVRTIFKAMYSEKFESEYNRFMSKRAIIDEFRNISLSHVGAFEPKEYSGAMDYISDFANKLNEFLSSNKANDVSIGNDLYKKYLNMFRGNKLVVPVTDFDEFDSLLDSMKFSDKESGDIKMFVGLGNIELLLPDDKDELTVLNKYEIILKNKYSKYKDTIVLLKGESFSLDTFDESLDRIKGRLNVNYDDVRQAMCCVLLGKKISEYKDVSAKKDMPANIKKEYLSSLEEELDKITIKSREQSSKEEETKVNEMAETLKALCKNLDNNNMKVELRKNALECKEALEKLTKSIKTTSQSDNNKKMNAIKDEYTEKKNNIYDKYTKEYKQI